jgi:hypothetical protein
VGCVNLHRLFLVQQENDDYLRYFVDVLLRDFHSLKENRKFTTNKGLFLKLTKHRLLLLDEEDMIYVQMKTK